MKRYYSFILFAAFALLTVVSIAFTHKHPNETDIISYTVDPKIQDLRFYWKDDNGHILGSIQHLKNYLDNKQQKLVFATNGGMFKPDNSPVGLFIQQNVILNPLDTTTGNGNFYLKPNGVLYITDENKAVICQTSNFANNKHIKFATQSGPMLLIDGSIHPALKKGSANVNVRNGVGILADNKLVFAMSTRETNFYDFAEYFKSLGCVNALYLDGFVSRTYLPEKEWMQTDGSFGVIIGVTIPKKK
ncbi:Uncharacterized protein YigE, DUF2233 family [Chitinophaga sp. CF118]|uniref:phosphodiester glycosidase family protein n=1 Tax=Chitinophaga sp. CF118 TaxID=1884367 RepID=UPI0008E4A4F0|nr:phosphodiester glycosidase family protein [Chitinophaga sp. CF118]SFD17374.1 Uncharacterized protein YigE, DUF2233 family [Chitinophaga sp. CF118]